MLIADILFNYLGIYICLFIQKSSGEFLENEANTLQSRVVVKTIRPRTKKLKY